MLLQGKSIDLRQMNETDLQIVYFWRNSNDVSKFMISQNKITIEEHTLWFSKIKNNIENLYFIIVSKNQDKLGVINFNKINQTEKTAEPGLYIGDVDNRNTIYGLEAYYLLLSYGFKELKLKKIIGQVLSTNKTAIKMNESFGFTFLNNNLNDNTKLVLNLYLIENNFFKSPMYKFFNNNHNKSNV